MKVHRKREQQSGAAMVEAALVLLTFLIMMFAIFEAGRMLSIQQTLTNAAREGARLSVLPLQGGTDTLPSTTAVQTRVSTFLNASGLNGAVATVAVNQCCDTNFPSPNSCTAPSGSPAKCAAGSIAYSRVTVTVPYKIVSISMFSLLEVTLQGQATMRNETNLQ
jgi:Flp pilus assembly protein TadG